MAIFLRQDLDVIPPKGEEQKSLNLRKKERKKEMDTDWKLRQKGYCYMGAPGIRPALKDTLREKCKFGHHLLTSSLSKRMFFFSLQ